MRKIDGESLTNCPICAKKKPFKYRGLCPDCQEEQNEVVEDE